MVGAAEGEPGEGVGGLEAIRRVKEVEATWEKRLKDARGATESALAIARSQSEGLVADARAQADRDRETAILRSRTEAEAEAREVVAEGQRVAGGIRPIEEENLATRREAVLDAVLGGFRPTRKDGV